MYNRAEIAAARCEMEGSSDKRALLILLVGTNPLPDYLAACALRPAKIALIHSPETRLMSERLEKCLAKALDPTPGFERVCVNDAARASDISREVSRLVHQYRDSWQVLLNYTGGTKVMAAHALRAFYESRGRSENASYLDDGGPGASPALRFDDGTTRTLAEYAVPPLRLDTLLALHGWRMQFKAPRQPSPNEDDVEELAGKVLADPPLAGRLYHELNASFPKGADPKKHTQQPFDPQEFGLALSIGAFPTEAQLRGLAGGDERKSWLDRWTSFLKGGWLEAWVASKIRETGVLSSADPHPVWGFDVFLGSGKVQAEIDVAVVRDYRSYFVSCTTARDKATCKQKLFEIAVRARQLAGDLARPALACLAEGHTLGQLRDEVQDETAGGGALQVPGLGRVHIFGLEDLRAWAGWGGVPPNLESLRDWLES